MAGRACVYFKKYVLMFYGIVFSSLGVAIMYYSELGSAPIAVFNEGVHVSTGISIGTSNTIVCIVMIIAALIIDRKLISAGTFILSFGTGILMDFCIEMVGYIYPEAGDFTFRLISIFVATGIVGLGVGMTLAANAGVAAFEAFALPLGEKIHIPYKYLCIIVNVLFAAVGWLMGGTFGICTIIFGVFSGFIIDYTTKFSTGVFAKGLGLEGLDIY